METHQPLHQAKKSDILPVVAQEKDAVGYASDHIKAKVTDKGWLIPPGTKYTGSDLIAWYNETNLQQKSLDPQSFNKPETWNEEFKELFQMWADAAHINIDEIHVHFRDQNATYI